MGSLRTSAAGSPTKTRTGREIEEATQELEAKGHLHPIDDARRLTLFQILPADIAADVTMHSGLSDYNYYETLQKFVIKYVKALQHLRRYAVKPAQLMDAEPIEDGGGNSVDDHEEADLLDRLWSTEDVGENIEILAVMKARGFWPPTRLQGGQRRLGQLNGGWRRPGG